MLCTVNLIVAAFLQRASGLALNVDQAVEMGMLGCLLTERGFCRLGDGRSLGETTTSRSLASILANNNIGHNEDLAMAKSMRLYVQSSNSKGVAFPA